jgi:Reverse transcriptase (RNA-dependent DNA polymerase).
LEKTSGYGINTFHFFSDIKAAYDTIKRNKLLEPLKEFHIPPKLIRLIKLILKHVRCRVKIQNNLSEQFETSVGLKGDALSCILFNLALKEIVRELDIETKGTVYNQSTQILAYADDVIIEGTCIDALKDTVKKLMKTAQVMELTVNVQRQNTWK